MRREIFVALIDVLSNFLQRLTLTFSVFVASRWRAREHHAAKNFRWDCDASVCPAAGGAYLRPPLQSILQSQAVAPNDRHLNAGVQRCPFFLLSCLVSSYLLATMPMPTRKLIVTSTLAFSAALSRSPGVQGFSLPATEVTVKRKRSSSSSGLFANKPKSSEASLPSESKDDPSAAAAAAALLPAPQSKLYLLDEDEAWESGVGNSATDDEDSEAAECYIDDLDQHGESCLVSDTDSSLPAIRIGVDADNIDVILKWVPILSPIIAFFTYEITAEVFDQVIEWISDRTWVAVDGGKCN